MAAEDVIALHEAEIGRRPRVLDFGVGFGRLAIPRIEAGLDIYGVEVSADDVDAARAALAEAGGDPDRIALLDADGRAPFADGSFDVIYSEDVLEHVMDLDVAVREIRRLTAPEGIGLHSYPGRRRPIESHLLMPGLQWLPRNRILHAAILGWTLLGLRPSPAIPQPSGGRRQRAHELYDGMLVHTRYRARREVDAAFRRAGFAVSSPRPGWLSSMTHEYVLTRLR